MHGLQIERPLQCFRGIGRVRIEIGARPEGAGSEQHGVDAGLRLCLTDQPQFAAGIAEEVIVASSNDRDVLRVDVRESQDVESLGVVDAVAAVAGMKLVSIVARAASKPIGPRVADQDVVA